MTSKPKPKASYAVTELARRAAVGHAERSIGESKSLGRLVRIDIIEPDPTQPRLSTTQADDEALTESVRRHGVIQPVVVDRNNKLIFGERRYRAALAAGLTEIPVVFRDEAEPKELLRLQLVENIHRRDMGVVAEGLAALRYLELEFGLSFREAKSLVYEVRRDASHSHRGRVESALRELLEVSLNTFATFHMVTLNLPDELLEHVRARRLDPSLALAINRLPADRQPEALRGALAGTLSQRDVEAMTERRKRPSPSSFEQHFSKLARSARFRTQRDGSSALTLEFDSREQLERFLKKLEVKPEGLDQVFTQRS
jgi:ParB family transcriptional regulator, chromosome partitioning protein